MIRSPLPFSSLVMSCAMRALCCAATLCTGLAGAAPSTRQPASAATWQPVDTAPSVPRPVAPTAWHAVGAAQLDAARGGFQLPSGLAVGFGIERTVAINGELVAHTRFAIDDMRTLTAGQAAQAREALSTVQLIRDGRSAATAGLPAAAWSPALGATVIQNSLDNQRLDSRTVINASVNTLGGLRSLNFSSHVLDSLARSALPH